MFFYSIGENIKNIIALMYTKLIWKNARLVRLPFYARNQRNIIMSKGFTCGYNCRLSAGSDIVGGKIIFGKNFTMGDNCQLEGQGGLTIGDDVLLASRVFIGTTSHGKYVGERQDSPTTKPNERKIYYQSVEIGNNCWIGNGVVILSGVTIGNGCIVGANSVITKNIPDECMVVGVPARIIKKYSKDTGRWELYMP